MSARNHGLFTSTLRVIRNLWMIARVFDDPLCSLLVGRDIFRQPLLDTAPLGMIGGHHGQLPQIRGMSAVEWSVMLAFIPRCNATPITPLGSCCPQREKRMRSGWRRS
jgi:hypothetical protein